MKLLGIPELVGAAKSCDKKLTYNGVITVDKLPRFLAQQSAEAESSSVVEAKFVFERDQQNLKVARVSYCALAMLTCQRCLGSMEYRIEGEVTFAFSSTPADLEQIPKAYEPILIESSTVNLWQVLEDELLLSLPTFANHADEHCNISLDKLKSDQTEQVAENPFATLGELLKK